MKQLILHIPHSSTQLPLKNGYVVSDSLLESEILKLTDWHTEDLFYSEGDVMVVAPFSRIFCDPERFADDSQEVMAQFGMGVLYEKMDSGEIMRNVTPELRERVLTEYYWVHHNRLSKAVEDQLNQFGQATIIDCHSFPAVAIERALNKEPNRPDFNIGTDSYHTPQKLIEISVEFFKANGFTLGVDWPYSGSIVPMEYYQKNECVHSIMLEINRKLYLKDGTNEKSAGYPEIKKVTNEYIQEIKKWL